jgi:hypothetical protein
MQLVYVDESGDPGGPTPATLAQGTSRHFILSSVAIDEGDWDQSLRTLVDIRTRLLARHGLPPWTGIHARDIVFPTDRSPFRLLRNRAERVGFLQELVRMLAAGLTQVRVASVILDKQAVGPACPPVEHAWSLLLTHLEHRLRSDGVDRRAMILADDTNEAQLRRLIRCMRHGVPFVPGGPPPDTRLERIIEDPVLRQSHHSFPIQVADIVAYTLYQHRWPKGSLRRYGASQLYPALEPLLDRGLKSRAVGTIDGVIEA